MATSTMAEAERTFTLFPLLPPELRLLIYSFALPSSRLIYPFQLLYVVEQLRLPACTCSEKHEREDGHHCRKDNRFEHNYNMRQCALPIRTDPFWYPGILAVNTEAREFALKHYEVYMDEKWPDSPLLIDFKRDMFLSGDNSEYDFTPRLTQNLYRFSEEFEEGDDMEDFVRELRVTLPSLRRMHFQRRTVRVGTFDEDDWVLVWKDGEWDMEMYEVWRETCCFDEVDGFEGMEDWE